MIEFSDVIVTGGQAQLDSDYVDSHDKSFADMIERLFRQFEDRLPLTSIVRVARESRDQLRGSPAGAMPELTERLAIERLTTLSAVGLHPVPTSATELSQA